MFPRIAGRGCGTALSPCGQVSPVRQTRCHLTSLLGVSDTWGLDWKVEPQVIDGSGLITYQYWTSTCQDGGTDQLIDGRGAAQSPSPVVSPERPREGMAGRGDFSFPPLGLRKLKHLFSQEES